MATYKDAQARAPGRMGRVMKSQMNISLPVELHERLREIAWEHRQPLSHVCRALLEEALRVHKEYGEGQPVEASK